MNGKTLISQIVRGLWNGLQWAFAGVVVLCAFVALFESSYLSLGALIVSAWVVAPPTRHLLMRWTQGKLTRKKSLLAVGVFLIVGIVNIQQSSNEFEAEPVVDIPVATTHESVSAAPKKPAQIERIEKNSSGAYDVVGYGPVYAMVTARLANGKTSSAMTNGDGFFVAVLPSDTTPVGTIELLEYASEGDNMYNRLHEPYHYTFFAPRPMISDVPFRPMLTRVSKQDVSMKIEGFSEPNTQVILRYKDAEIGNVMSNEDGYFVFEKVEKKEHFMQLFVVHGTVSELMRASFVDTTVHTLNTVLPRWTKKITAKEAIAFTVSDTDDASLTQGETRVVQEGQDGVKTVYYTVTYVGAEEVARVATKEVIDTTPVEKVVQHGTYVTPAPTYSFTEPVSPTAPTSTYYANCSVARAAGVTPIYQGQPGYGTHLDRDRDGVACEN